MRLVEFLILLLEAQAETLGRMAAFLGEEELLRLLEDYGDRFSEITGGTIEERARKVIETLRLEPPFGGNPELAYQELETAVHDSKLPAMLEFYLWTYPFYRAFVESSLELNARIPPSSHFQGADTGTFLVDEAMAQSRDWIRHMPLPPQIAPQAERAAFVPWLRFRTAALKRIGKRPVGPVY